MTQPAPAPSQKQIVDAFADLKRIHNIHLTQHGVRLPTDGSNKAIWLGVLWACKDREVHKEEMSAIVQREKGGNPADQQVRHLKRDGWNIVEGAVRGAHRLDNPYQPSPDWLNERARRQGQLAATTFDELKRAFGNRCATCGATDGEPDPRYGRTRVQLQQGHRDPALPDTDRENIIPQCQFCNRQYRRDFVFDEKGRVRAVADVGPVSRASSVVQRKILAFLKGKFKE